MTKIPHNTATCTCPACVFVRDSEPPQLEGLSYLNKSCVMRVISVERTRHGMWMVNIEAVPRPGYEKYFDNGKSKPDRWTVENWNDQVRKHKGNR